MNQTEEKLMNSPTPEKVSEEAPSAKSAFDSAVIAEKETNAERILSFMARLTSNSTDELDKAIAELERLQEFLKSETGRV
jgi:hypothetical protein